MGSKTRCLRFLHLALLAGVLICQYPVQSQAHYDSPVMDLEKLLGDLSFTPQQKKVLVSVAVNAGVFRRWVRYGRESYNWLNHHLRGNMKGVILFRPWLLGLSVEAHLEPRTETLRGLGVTDVFELFSRDPELLNPNVPDENILEMAELLKEEGVGDHLKLIHEYPRILMQQDLTEVSSSISWLKSTFKIDKIGPLLEGFPNVFDYKPTELIPTFEALRDSWFFETGYVKAHPMLLQLSDFRLQELEEALKNLKLDLYADLTPDERRWMIVYSNPFTILDNLKALGHLPEDAESTAGAAVSPGWLSKHVDKWAFDPDVCEELFGTGES